MGNRVHFTIDGNEDESYDLDDVPVPPQGTRVEFDGKAYLVDSSIITYWSENPSETMGHVEMSTILDEH